MVNHDIRIDGQLLVPRALNHGIPYLGARLQLDLDNKSAVTTINGKIQSFCRAVERHRLRPDRAIWAFNTFLIPSISYALAFIHPTVAEYRKWDKRVARAISICCQDTILFLGRRMLPEFIACVTGLILPSCHYRMLAVSEPFLNLNAPLPSSTMTRSRLDTRVAMKHNRLAHSRAVGRDLGIDLHRVARSDRHTGAVERIVIPHHATPVVAFTDGSLAEGRSSWAFVICNNWLDSHFACCRVAW